MLNSISLRNYPAHPILGRKQQICAILVQTTICQNIATLAVNREFSMIFSWFLTPLSVSYRKVKIAPKWSIFQVLGYFDRKMAKKRLFDQFLALSFALPR